MCLPSSNTSSHEELPKALKPSHYDLFIKNIDLIHYTFKGSVVIRVSILEETNQLSLNYRDLVIDESSYLVELVDSNGTSERISVVETVHNKEKEFFTLTFDRNLIPQSNDGCFALITIGYSGIIQTNMAGFYRSRYEYEGEDSVMLSTQFEATDARRALPCLDEPNLKTTFDLKLEVTKNWTALSNMPIKSVDESSSKHKVVEFETTPVMSTYLLAWACGEFEYIEAFTEKVYGNGKPLPVRVYTTKSLTPQGEFALNFATKVIDYFSTIFEVDYALPKLDLIAVHEFSHGAMENWGLITYRSTTLLFNAETSDPSYKQKVAYVVAHELAHQWFGNLVTMDWWNELWLNEGFATWVGFTAVDHIYPEWDLFAGFVSESLQSALDLDGSRGSHPIEVPVYNALDIDQVFDAISYLKGASTILMLSSSIGNDIFLKGVANYLKKHKFKNAKTKDLWDSISEVSQTDIGKIMKSWITKIGFPVLKVRNDMAGKIVISQHRFLNGGDVKPEEDETLWWIPLNISLGPEESDVMATNSNSFDTKEISIDEFREKKFFKLNKDSKGVYRVSYSLPLMKNIISNVDKLSAKDKVGLIADTTATAISGDGSTSTLLQLINSLKHHNSDYVVWLELGIRLSQLLSTWFEQPETIQRKLIEFAQSVYREKALEMISTMNQIDSEDYLAVKLRANILTKAGSYGIPEAVAKASEIFDQWVKGTPIHPSLRVFVFSTMCSTPELINEKSFGYILEEVTKPKSLDGREIALIALGKINNKELGSRLIRLLIDPSIVSTMDSHFLGRSLAQNPTTRVELWDFFKNHYNEFFKLMSTNMVVLDRFIKITFGVFSSEAKHDEIANFFKDKNVHGFDRSLKQVLDSIKTNSNWVKRDAPDVEEWLRSSEN